MTNNIDEQKIIEMQAWVRAFNDYKDIPNANYEIPGKIAGFMSLGFTREAAEKMCKPKPISKAQIMEAQERELKRLAKLDKEAKRAAKLVETPIADEPIDMRVADDWVTYLNSFDDPFINGNKRSMEYSQRTSCQSTFD